MARPRVWGDTPVHTAIIDWDGTAVPAMWPEQPDRFMPGFEDNMLRLNAAGVRIVIASARLSPYDPWTSQRRDPAVVFGEVMAMRNLLDSKGLTFIDIWTKEGKPGGSVYVDDKAERYAGRKGSWDKVTDRILMRLGKEDAVFPAFDQTKGA